MNKIGILDPDGENNNPLTLTSYSDEYKLLAKKWSTLPAYINATDKIQQIKDHNIISIISGTGSGKTVLIPKYVLHVFNYDAKIAIVLPKRILTETNAKYSALTLDVKLGVDVGFKHKDNKMYNKEKTKLLYTTDGSLVSMLLSNPLLSNFNAVIIDEAHERRTQTDFLLYLLKQTCIKRPEFKLIIMSATIDENIFANYFSEFKYSSMNISGKTNFPITHVYSKSKIDKSKYIEYGLQRIKEILNTTTEGDILFFVPNVNETFNICLKLATDEIYCVEVYSGMSKENEMLAVDKDLYKKIKGIRKRKRKIVIATNVAESSLTIDGIKYVIDSGYENIGYYDPTINSKILEKKLASQAQIKQRCGRTGRTCHGICYHLYTEIEYKQLDKFPKPAIQTSDIHEECLSLLKWDIIQNFNNLEKILLQFIEPPTQQYIDSARKKLFQLQLIDNNGKITDLGNFIAQFNERPNRAITLLASWLLNCHKELIIIFIMIDLIKFNMDELFTFNKNENENDSKSKNKNKNKIKKSLLRDDGDHFNLLRIYSRYKLSENKNEWIKKYYIKKHILDKTDKIYKKTKKEIIYKIKKYFNDNDIKNDDLSVLKDLPLKKKILIALMFGFGSNIAKMTEYGYNIDTIDTINVARDSNMLNKEYGLLLYTDVLTINGKSQIQINSKITKEIIDISKKISIVNSNNMQGGNNFFSRIIHMNDPIMPYMEKPTDKWKYFDDIKIPTLTNCHWGALKLFYSELEFMVHVSKYINVNECLVLYIGAQPGFRLKYLFIKHFYPNIKMLLYDPRDFDIKEDEQIIIKTSASGWFTDETIDEVLKIANGRKIIYITDIRLSDDDNYTREYLIHDDMQKQQRWGVMMGAEFMLLKFRMFFYQRDPHEVNFIDNTIPENYSEKLVFPVDKLGKHKSIDKWLLHLDGTIFSQIYAGNRSTETRLFVKKIKYYKNNKNYSSEDQEKYKMKYYDNIRYEGLLNYFNMVTRNKKLEYEDAKNIYKLCKIVPGFDVSYSSASEYYIMYKYLQSQMIEPTFKNILTKIVLVHTFLNKRYANNLIMCGLIKNIKYKNELNKNCDTKIISLNGFDYEKDMIETKFNELLNKKIKSINVQLDNFIKTKYIDDKLKQQYIKSIKKHNIYYYINNNRIVLK